MREQTVDRATGLERRSELTSRREVKPASSPLESLIRLIEHEIPDMRGSVLLLDDDATTLRHGAAPHLPPEYCRLIDGARIGPASGSCGTAAFRREQVIVSDIESDPLWADYRDVALRFGLHACWSTPIIDQDDALLGTFAMYYDEPRVPTARELGLTQTATMLACNIIVRARVEEALRESEAEMLAARAEAEHVSRTKAAFLEMMTRELRTPLNAIGGYATLMLDGIPTPASDAHRNYLRRIIKAQQHLIGLIDAVLTHARLDSGRMSYRFENIRVGELIESVESASSPQRAEKQITFDCDGCESRLVLRGDRQKVLQILQNIMSNAVKFTPKGGRITVRTGVPAPGRVLIGVRDTGIGMNVEEVATVFEPFVRFDDRLTGPEKGAGLEMPISRDLARGMGGDLTVVSEPGAGTEFLLTLPMDVGDAAPE